MKTNNAKWKSDLVLKFVALTALVIPGLSNAGTTVINCQSGDNLLSEQSGFPLVKSSPYAESTQLTIKVSDDSPTEFQGIVDYLFIHGRDTQASVKFPLKLISPAELVSSCLSDTAYHLGPQSFALESLDSKLRLEFNKMKNPSKTFSMGTFGPDAAEQGFTQIETPYGVLPKWICTFAPDDSNDDISNASGC